MQDAYEHLRQELNGFMPSCILIAVAELDLGTIIIENGNNLTANNISNLAKCDLRGCSSLLDSMVALGYFSKKSFEAEKFYSVNNEYIEYLDSRTPTTCIPMIRHIGCVQRRWIQLAQSVRDGISQKGIPSILGVDQDKVSFIMGMNSIAMRLRDSVVSSVLNAGILSKNKDVDILDVGGASGTYTDAFLNLLPKAKATIFDLPVGIAQAEKRFSDSPHYGRVKLVAGDFTKNDLPSGFGFAWVSAIIHQMGRDDSRKLYKKILNALNPGGIIAIRDYVMDDDHTKPTAGALFGINMLVSTPAGRVYSYSEIKDDLLAVGFVDVRQIVDAPTMEALVIAYKPSKNPYEAV